jgi:pilus assembly protein CpaB
LSNRTKIVLIIVAGLILVVIGIFASATLIQRLRPSQEPEAVEEVTVKTDVVVMTRDLYLGDTIASGDVKLTSVPVEIAPRNVLTSIEEAVGKIVKTDLIQGEMLLSHNLASPTNSNNDLSFFLSDNHVLMAFPADDLMSRESMIKTGDIVDIFATFTEKVKTVGETTTTDQDDEPETRTFTVDAMQNVTVTAMVLDVIVEEDESNTLLDGETVDDTRPEAKIEAYLLALDPQDALILKHLKDTDAIFDIVLRAPTSTVQFYLTPVTEEYIIEFFGLEILP